jgi:hypothetical protein
MINNLMNYNINELKTLYNNTNDDFIKFFIKKVIKYKIYQTKNKPINHIIKNDVLDDLMNHSMNNKINDTADFDVKEIPEEKIIEDKYLKEIKFDSANNKLLERLNVESTFISTNKNKTKHFVSPFIEDGLYNQQFMNDKYIESIKNISHKENL